MKRFLMFVLLFAACQVQAGDFTYKSLMEREWNGYSTIDANWVQGGKAALRQKITNVVYNPANNTFSAQTETSMKLDGTEYFTKTQAEGDVDTSSHVVHLRHLRTLRADSLPGGLRWTHDDIYLTIYNDVDHAGHFILQEKKSDGSEMTFGDAPM